MHRSMSSSVIKQAFPNYYQRTKENYRIFQQSAKEAPSELPKRSFLAMNSSFTPSNSFNYVLPDPEAYDLTKRRDKKREHSSMSLQPKRNQLKSSLSANRFTPKKLISLKPHPKAALVKENFIRLRGYNEYSQFSPKRSFFREKEGKKKLTRYLLHNVLQPDYQRDQERVKKREATKLIEKKYQFLPGSKPVVAGLQNNASLQQNTSIFNVTSTAQPNHSRIERADDGPKDLFKNTIYKQRIISPIKRKYSDKKKFNF